jgi:hypothetical protein
MAAETGGGQRLDGQRLGGTSNTKGQSPRTGNWPSVLSLTTGRRPLAHAAHAENELPQPQPPVELGFLNVKPDPCIDET